ncbi:MAG: hypothetical protein ACP5OG_06185 [Candidatus Nanoarchaeia archaeon]
MEEQNQRVMFRPDGNRMVANNVYNASLQAKQASMQQPNKQVQQPNNAPLQQESNTLEQEKPKKNINKILLIILIVLIFVLGGVLFWYIN